MLRRVAAMPARRSGGNREQEGRRLLGGGNGREALEGGLDPLRLPVRGGPEGAEDLPAVDPRRHPHLCRAAALGQHLGGALEPIPDGRVAGDELHGGPQGRSGRLHLRQRDGDCDGGAAEQLAVEAGEGTGELEPGVPGTICGQPEQLVVRGSGLSVDGEIRPGRCHGRRRYRPSPSGRETHRGFVTPRGHTESMATGGWRSRALWRTRPYLAPYRRHITFIVISSIVSSAGHGRGPADRQGGDRRPAGRRRPGRDRQVGRC